MNIREVVLIYDDKHFVTKDLLITLAQRNKMESFNSLVIGTEIVYEIPDLKLLNAYEKYNLDVILKSFVAPTTKTQKFRIKLNDCFYLGDYTLIPLGKLNINKKYYLKHVLPLVKIFGKYFVVCNKQKDVNANVAIMTER